jgi:hypothetical protein
MNMANAANEHDNKNDKDDKNDPSEEARAEQAKRDRKAGTVKESGPSFAAAEHAVVRDLSPELMTTLPREAGEMVRCRRIYGDHNRCNWWASQHASQHDMAGMSGLMITRYRVVKSRMLRATATGEGLAIDAERKQ